ncbi:AraC family transcriptional regulator [Massilia sp. B-10]|nr:AraC family transcriptional regulator [Massilia sp. B-10]
MLVPKTDADAARALAEHLRRAVASLRHHTQRTGQPIQVSMRYAARSVDADPRQLLKELNRALERRMSALEPATDSALHAARRAERHPPRGRGLHSGPAPAYSPSTSLGARSDGAPGRHRQRPGRAGPGGGDHAAPLPAAAGQRGPSGLKSADTSFLLGQQLLPGHYGALSHALLHAASLREALGLLVRHQLDLCPLLAPHLCEEGDLAVLYWTDSLAAASSAASWWRCT